MADADCSIDLSDAPRVRGHLAVAAGAARRATSERPKDFTADFDEGPRIEAGREDTP